MRTATRIEQRVEELLKKMTVSEKVSLLSGKDIWNTAPIKRLGIPSITMTDGPHGVRSTAPEAGRKMGAATAFPTGISMGAAWNPELVEQVGQGLVARAGRAPVAQAGRAPAARVGQGPVARAGQGPVARAPVGWKHAIVVAIAQWIIAVA